MSGYLRVADVAEDLGVSPRTVAAGDRPRPARGAASPWRWASNLANCVLGVAGGSHDERRGSYRRGDRRGRRDV